MRIRRTHRSMVTDLVFRTLLGNFCSGLFSWGSVWAYFKGDQTPETSLYWLASEITDNPATCLFHFRSYRSGSSASSPNSSASLLASEIYLSKTRESTTVPRRSIPSSSSFSFSDFSGFITYMPSSFVCSQVWFVSFFNVSGIDCSIEPSLEFLGGFSGESWRSIIPWSPRLLTTLAFPTLLSWWELFLSFYDRIMVLFPAAHEPIEK